MQENKSTNKKPNEKPGMKEKASKKIEDDRSLKENLKSSNLSNAKAQKKETVVENEDFDEENPYANITIRNLNKYFNEKDFDYDNNESYLAYVKHKSII